MTSSMIWREEVTLLDDTNVTRSVHNSTNQLQAAALKSKVTPPVMCQGANHLFSKENIRLDCAKLWAAQGFDPGKKASGYHTLVIVHEDHSERKNWGSVEHESGRIRI